MIRATLILSCLLPAMPQATLQNDETGPEQTAMAEELLPDVSPAAHNVAFEAATQSGRSPQTTAERQLCAAVWNRWNYVVESAGNPRFAPALRPELSVANATAREAFWHEEAARQLDRTRDLAEVRQEKAHAEEKADDLYAAYANNEERGLEKLMEQLGICR